MCLKFLLSILGCVKAKALWIVYRFAVAESKLGRPKILFCEKVCPKKRTYAPNF